MIPKSWVIGCEDYVINEAVIEAVSKMRAGEAPKIDPEQRYLCEERAGIIEFCGNAPRRIAEQEARRQYPNGCPVLGEGPQKDDL